MHQQKKVKSLLLPLALILIMGVSIVSLLTDGFIYRHNKNSALLQFERLISRLNAI